MTLTWSLVALPFMNCPEGAFFSSSMPAPGAADDEPGLPEWIVTVTWLAPPARSRSCRRRPRAAYAREVAHLDVLAQEALVVLAREPLRIPVIDGADAEDFRVDFVSHISFLLAPRNLGGGGRDTCFLSAGLLRLFRMIMTGVVVVHGRRGS